MEGGRKIAENTYYIYDYLLNTLDRDFLASLWGPLDMKVAYHIPCHLKALGIGYPLREILLQIPSLKSFVRDENCCGLSGSYGFKKENEKTSQTIGKLAAETLQNTGAQVIISDCGACRMQLGHLTGLPALDPIEIILSSLLTAGNRLSFYHLLTGAASYRAK
jgi:glycerol-3-phosphate dehydrogenase subunit C